MERGNLGRVVSFGIAAILIYASFYRPEINLWGYVVLRPDIDVWKWGTNVEFGFASRLLNLCEDGTVRVNGLVASGLIGLHNSDFYHNGDVENYSPERFPCSFSFKFTDGQPPIK